jgi:hypothetical protein
VVATRATREAKRYYRQLPDMKLLNMMGTLVARMVAAQELLQERDCKVFNPPKAVEDYFEFVQRTLEELGQ